MGNAIKLRKIDESNWKEAINLKVGAEQEEYVASNVYSLAQYQFLKDFKAMGIYSEEEDRMIGFAMYGIDPDDGNYWIYRLMVDKGEQGRGFGKLALQLIVEDIKANNDKDIPCIILGFHPENHIAKGIYLKGGFVETEMAPWGEQLARLELKKMR
ncbi:RimJ/RimL family protein N-acetyltransferase [Bacillus tianshenii]|uniref:RimJ/RimL family protein N-acetyltransferase n=1 Tax=Sutcliffiella tianshenii TaxID=1463404 RepID=A0ABS2NZS8_9BACI|nr:GNAT family N-acetyltransferase [Bacillus tianshenii]MBM7620136.1 RimJ/RimL family protein N-acetyltransferase [Bacillus tianshenii]